MAPRLDTFGLQPGRKIGPRYVVETMLGRGSEGEVYQIRELDTGISRAAKFYFSHRNSKHHLTIKHAQKLNELRRCSIVLQYHHSEAIIIRKQKVIAMISDLCDFEQLENWIDQHPGRRLNPYKAMHVLYHLAKGIEAIHALGHYHADVHSENILIKPTGVSFDLKLVDFYDWGKPTRNKLQQDIIDTVRVFYDCLGGKRWYAKLPPDIKYLCAGLKHNLILERFPTITAMRQHLETFEWMTII